MLRASRKESLSRAMITMEDVSAYIGAYKIDGRLPSGEMSDYKIFEDVQYPTESPNLATVRFKRGYGASQTLMIARDTDNPSALTFSFFSHPKLGTSQATQTFAPNPRDAAYLVENSSPPFPEAIDTISFKTITNMDEIGRVLTAYLAECTAKLNTSFQSLSAITYSTRVAVNTPDKHAHVFRRNTLDKEEFSKGYPVKTKTFLSKTTPENTGLSLSLCQISPFCPVLAQIIPFKVRIEGRMKNYEYDNKRYPVRKMWSRFDLYQIHKDYQQIYVETFPNHRFSK